MLVSEARCNLVKCCGSMLSRKLLIDHSVTLKSGVLLRRPWVAQRVFDWGQVKANLASAQLSAQRRRDASMSSAQVQQLLMLAAAGGMSQREFELTAGRLRPNEATSTGTLGGRLWHHYMHADSTARMSCVSFSEYLQAFHESGWITFEEGAEFAQLAVAVEMAVTGGDSMISLNEKFVREFLIKKFPGASRRVIGSFLKNCKGACKSEDQYLEFLIDLPNRIIGLENFGTNLAQLPLKSGEVP